MLQKNILRLRFFARQRSIFFCAFPEVASQRVTENMQWNFGCLSNISRDISWEFYEADDVCSACKGNMIAERSDSIFYFSPGEFIKVNKCVWHLPLCLHKSPDFVSVHGFSLEKNQQHTHWKARNKKKTFPQSPHVAYILIFHFTEKYCEEGRTSSPHVYPPSGRIYVCSNPKGWVERTHCFENKNAYLKERLKPFFWHFHSMPIPPCVVKILSTRKLKAKRLSINLRSPDEPLSCISQ